MANIGPKSLGFLKQPPVTIIMSALRDAITLFVGLEVLGVNVIGAVIFPKYMYALDDGNKLD